MAENRHPGIQRSHSRAARAFQTIEHAFYIVIAVALALAGAALFVHAIYSFLQTLGEGAFVRHILTLLDTMLLVFIVAELLHTVRAVIDRTVLKTEPFLIVGIVAVIRRLIVISAEAQDVGGERFNDLMLEMAILVGAVFGLGATVFLLRHTEHSEPPPVAESEQP